MAFFRALIDVSESVEDLSAILNNHDNSGDVDPDDFVRMCSVAAALAFCNVKMKETDRGDYNVDDFKSQLLRVDDKVREYYEGDSYSVVRTAIDVFISDITASLIMAIEDQRQTPVFEEISEDLNLVFKVMDGVENESENAS